MSESPTPGVDPRKKIEAEIKRMQAKRGEVSDRDIRAALDLAIKGREDELAALGGPTGEPVEFTNTSATKEKEEVVPETLPDPPTPAALEQAEKIIQQARLERRRENNSRAAELLDEAVRIAPGASSVQEMVGDDCMERRQWKAALAHYDMARKLDPNNVSADKKYAETVFQTKASAATASMSLEYQREQMATSARSGALFSLFLPGSGQLVLGEFWYGGFLIGTWVIMVFWVFLMNEDLKGVINKLGVRVGHVNPNPNYLVLLPLAVAIIIHFIAVASAAAEGGSIKMEKVAHPEPPMPNLPFE